MMTDEYWLHYIGKGLYSIDVFEREAKRFGVQRAIPFHMLKKFKWGDIILLAHWLRDENGEGQAEVFGYFIVKGISHDLPTEIKEKLREKLDIVSISSPGKIKYENRACGGYFLGLIIYVNDTPEDIEAKTKEVCKELGYDPNKSKWFLRGPYQPLNKTILLKPAKFTRGYIRVPIEGFNPQTLHLETGTLIWIYNYKQRTYLRKRDLHGLGSEPLDNFL